MQDIRKSASAKTPYNTVAKAGDLFLDAVTFKSAQIFAADMANFAAYRHAYKVLKEDFPKLDPFSGKGKVKLNEIFRDLTFRMNKSDPLRTEVSPTMSMIAMWTQHVHKMFKDTVYQPTIAAIAPEVVAKRLLPKNRSQWAKTRGQAATTTLLNGGLWGLAGWTSSEMVLSLDEKMRKEGLLEKGETLPRILSEGLVSIGAEEALGIKADIPGRLFVGDAPTMLLSLTGLDKGTLNLLGGAGVLGTKIEKFIDTIKVVQDTPLPTQEDRDDMINFLVQEGAGMFSGWSDANKADLLRNTGMYFTNSGLPVFTGREEDALGVTMSFKPREAVLREKLLFDGKEFSKDEKNYYNKVIPQTFGRMFWREVSNIVEEKGEITFDEFADLQARIGTMVHAATVGAGAGNLAFEAKQAFLKNTFFPEGVIKDAQLREKNQTLLNKITQEYSWEDAKAKLEQVVSLTDDPALRESAETILLDLELQKQILQGE